VDVDNDRPLALVAQSRRGQIEPRRDMQPIVRSEACVLAPGQQMLGDAEHAVAGEEGGLLGRVARHEHELRWRAGGGEADRIRPGCLIVADRLSRAVGQRAFAADHRAEDHAPCGRIVGSLVGPRRAVDVVLHQVAVAGQVRHRVQLAVARMDRARNLDRLHLLRPAGREEGQSAAVVEERAVREDAIIAHRVGAVDAVERDALPRRALRQRHAEDHPQSILCRSDPLSRAGVRSRTAPLSILSGAGRRSARRSRRTLPQEQRDIAFFVAFSQHHARQILIHPTGLEPVRAGA